MQNQRGLFFVEHGEIAAKRHKNDARKEPIRRYETYGLDYLKNPSKVVSDYVKCTKDDTCYFILTVDDFLSITGGGNLMEEIESHRMMQMLEQVFIFRMLDPLMVRKVCDELVVMHTHVTVFAFKIVVHVNEFSI